MKTLKVNSFIVASNRLINLAFPLLTYSYIARVLGTENLGIYNYAQSIINYFILLAGLGVASYSVREATAYRDDKKINDFISDIFSINIFSTFISYILLIILVVLSINLNHYKAVIGILSIQIVFTTLGMEWIYTIYEDFIYIPIRNLIVKFLSFILVITFVHTNSDLLLYALISVFASIGSNFFNFYYAKKKAVFKFRLSPSMWKHLKPICMLLVVDVAVNIYTNSDITMLGILCSDYEVGLYSVSVKLYSFIDNIIASIVIASFPKVSSLLGTGDSEKYYELSRRILETLLTMVFPMVTGMIFLSRELITIVAGTAYIAAFSSFILLSIALIFSILNWYYVRCVILPLKKEWLVLIITISSAALNVGLNCFLIPLYGQNAAGCTTILSGFFMVMSYMILLRKNVAKISMILIGKILIGCIGIGVSINIIKNIFSNSFLIIFTSGILSVTVYLLIEQILGNECVRRKR